MCFKHKNTQFFLFSSSINVKSQSKQAQCVGPNARFLFVPPEVEISSYYNDNGIRIGTANLRRPPCGEHCHLKSINEALASIVGLDRLSS